VDYVIQLCVVCNPFLHEFRFVCVCVCARARARVCVCEIQNEIHVRMDYKQQHITELKIPQFFLLQHGIKMYC